MNEQTNPIDEPAEAYIEADTEYEKDQAIQEILTHLEPILSSFNSPKALQESNIPFVDRIRSHMDPRVPKRNQKIEDLKSHLRLQLVMMLSSWDGGGKFSGYFNSYAPMRIATYWNREYISSITDGDGGRTKEPSDISIETTSLSELENG